jgi:tryptophanyl-tRNA synthetase
MSKIVFSGIRPTGNIHIGNYFGAIRNWVNTYENYDQRFFCVVDQHALTTREDSLNLYENCLTIASAYIASGIDYKKCNIFLQSHVPYHTELAWYFACVTPMGWLNRMTQFKDKAGKNQQNARLGLFAYPVLMAADILLYGATHVPVGQDQKQHVELARDIAQTFIEVFPFENNLFAIPEPVIEKESAKIMSLRDGTKKMGKSDISDYSRIHLLDDNDRIALKIKKAKTDSDLLPDNINDLESRLELKNLMTIHALCTKTTLESVCNELAGKDFSYLKKVLIESLVNHFQPIRQKMIDLLDDKDFLLKILLEGAERSKKTAEFNISKIKKAMGLF